jgi:hypothetical protein
MKYQLTPISSFFRAVGFLFTGRLKFPRNRVGEVIVLEAGENWVIFRQVVLQVEDNRPGNPCIIFRPRFHVARMSINQNIRFSILPILFFTGLPGFRSKLWLYEQKSGDFQGIYEWDTLQDAEAYSRSFAMRFMTARSIPGSVSFKIYPKN